MKPTDQESGSRSGRPLRYAVVTSHRVGFASRFVEHVRSHRSSRAALVAVILCRGAAPAPKNRWHRLRRAARKLRRIGLLGALNGLRMRRWYGRDVARRLVARDIADVCRATDVPLLFIDSFGDAGACETFSEIDVDVGISLGNSYIPRRFFEIPRLGMINVHCEVLPEYKGAQTALWQIHNGSAVSGFTIHAINERIDDGAILFGEEVPLMIRPTLHETIVDSTARVQQRSVEALADVLEAFPEALRRARPNTGGRRYTTPSARAMLRIMRQFRLLKLAAAAGPADRGD